MRAPLLAALLLAPVLAGCLDDGTIHAWSCDRLEARKPSQNAPLLASLSGEPLDVARRMATAVGDPLLTETPTREGWFGPVTAAWPTRQGLVEYHADEHGRFASVVYWTARHWTPLDGSRARDDFARVLRAFEIPEDVVDALVVDRRVETSQTRLEGEAEQTYRGETLLSPVRHDRSHVAWFYVAENRGPGDAPRVSRLDIGRMNDLSQAAPDLSERRAKDVAERAVRCALTAQGAPERHVATLEAVDAPTRWGVANESLARVAMVSYGEECLEMRAVSVFIDARTGAVVDPGYHGAGCVY